MENKNNAKQLDRKQLRDNGIDIEVQNIYTPALTTISTRQYRYVVVKWNKYWILEKTYYSDLQYDSYEQAENAAVEFANTLI